MPNSPDWPDKNACTCGHSSVDHSTEDDRPCEVEVCECEEFTELVG
jgi:hypothetical protein